MRGNCWPVDPWCKVWGGARGATPNLLIVRCCDCVQLPAGSGADLDLLMLVLAPCATLPCIHAPSPDARCSLWTLASARRAAAVQTLRQSFASCEDCCFHDPPVFTAGHTLSHINSCCSCAAHKPLIPGAAAVQRCGGVWKQGQVTISAEGGRGRHARCGGVWRQRQNKVSVAA